MIYTSIKLISYSITKNNIGVEQKTKVEKQVPIIKVEEVYANEFYQANEQGLKPELRIRISALSYDGQTLLQYGDIYYNVVRSSNPNTDEVVLICERKLGNIVEWK